MRLGLRSVSTAWRAVVWGVVGSVALAASAVAQPAELMLEPVGGGNFIDRQTGNLFSVRQAAAGFLGDSNCAEGGLVIAALQPPVVAGPDPAPPLIDPAALAAITEALAATPVAFRRNGNYAMTEGPFVWCGHDPPAIPNQEVPRMQATIGTVPPIEANVPPMTRADADALGVVAALLGGGINRVMCTGSLVGDRTLLTAAHCVCDGQLKGVVFTNDTRLVVPGDPSVKRGVLVSYRVHDDDFCRASDEERRSKIDLALVYTEAPIGIDPTRYLRPSGNPADLDGDAETIVGFGISNQVLDGGEKQQADLTEALGPVRPCTAAEAARGCNPGLELLAVNAPDVRRDTCPGDSGGPLLAWSADGTGVIVGITLRGLNGSTRICGEGGIYLDLTRSDLALWITNCLYENLAQEQCP